MSTTDEQALCLMCNSGQAKLCGRCQSTRYCSKECQKADWPIHKLLCGALANFDMTTRPSQSHFLAINFLPRSSTPKLVWLHCPLGPSGFHEPRVEHLVCPKRSQGEFYILYNTVLKRSTPDNLHLIYNDLFLMDGSVKNKIVAAMTSTKDRQCFDWRGPFVLYSGQGRDLKPRACRDITLSDFRHVTDYFRTYRATFVPRSIQLQPVQSVRLNCLGEQLQTRKPHFQSVQIAPTHPIFSANDISDVAVLVGLPLFTRLCRVNGQWAGERYKAEYQGNDPYYNKDGECLHLCCDPNIKAFWPDSFTGWGYAPDLWKEQERSLIIVRQDRKPLLPLHVEALCLYCRTEVATLMARSLGDVIFGEPLTRDAVLRAIDRNAFSAFWAKFVQGKRNRGQDVNVPSPYDV